MLQTVGQFNRLPNEDPHLRLKFFLEVSDAFKIAGATQDALRLRLFPYSLRDQARAWLNLLPSDSITTWNELADKFLMKYFPPTKNAKLRNEITSFHQLEDESLYEAWERFKELLRRCHHHSIPCCIQLETFYNGLNLSTRLMVDASANGALLSKSYTEAYEILERITNNNYQWPSTRQPAARGSVGVHNIDAITALSAQVTSLTNMVKAMIADTATVKQVTKLSCVYCGEEHDFNNCLGNPASVNYVGNFNRQPQNNPYSNTYNPCWKQHLNFSWSSQNRNAPALNGLSRNTQPPGFHQQSQGQKHISQDPITSLEALIKEYIAKNEAIVQSQAVSLRNLENQMGQLATTMSSRTQGSLPSNTEDPRGESKEHCKVISLRSGKTVDIPVERNNNNAQSSQASPPQNFQNTQPFVPYVPPPWKNLEDTMHSFIRKQDAINNQNAQTFSDLKDPLAKIAYALTIQEKEKFPAQPQPNPKIQNAPMDQVKSVITLRSGKVIDRPIPEPCENENSKGNEELDKLTPSEEITNVPSEPPFPHALNKPRKSNHSSEIYEIFKQVKVNIPLLDAIKQPNEENENEDEIDEQKELPESFIEDNIQKGSFSELSDICLVNSIESNKQLEHDTSNINLLFDSCQTLQSDDGKQKFEELGIIEKTEQQEAPKLELKPLPEGLKYAYLGEEQTYHIVISSTLSSDQEGQVLCDKLLGSLLELNIDRKLSSITVDNAATNDHMIDFMLLVLCKF
ncbi:hypothetical protein KPL71_023441 [Citrus sinensis]|uniref:Uncharacterized protein n=1 Tax=Citrus sinensis TaxID=2711 RepID=A0ACB8IJ66_CITSI|nr:hypothetical protein KPL71_023441 [Citrus sinensis]